MVSMFGSLGWQELVIVLIIVVIIFGAGRLPEIGGAVGKSIKEFKANSADEPDEITAGTADKASSAANSTAQEAKATASSASREVRADEI
jgi:sec-independent protein translocase protein TatA